MKILLSNDDGVHAIGIQILAHTLIQAGHDVVVVAPDRNRSGASNSLSLDRPLKIDKLAPNVFSIAGSPSDCVYLALHQILEDKPDAIISGVNHGPNLGDDVLYSGTVAAAMEGRSLGVPVIACSLAYKSNDREKHFETAAQTVVSILNTSADKKWPNKTILNVNVPNSSISSLQGTQVTRLGHRHPAGAPIETKDPKGISHYWLAAVAEPKDEDAGTDFYAISQGCVSITPLHYDMTNVDSMKVIKGWMDSNA